MRNAEEEDDDDENVEVFEDPVEEGEERGCLLSTVFTVTVVPAGMLPDFPDCSFLSAQKSLDKSR